MSLDRLYAELSRVERVSNAIERFARDRGLRLLLVALGTVVAMRLVRIALWRVRRRLERLSMAGRRPTDPERLQVLFDVLNYLGVALVITLGVMSALSAVGVDTSALLASAGVLGFAVGFGAQTMVKDLLNGLFLLAEGQYTIGDTIEVNGVAGVVERVTLRTTTLRGSNGDVHIVSSGDVRLVTNKSKGWSKVVLDVGVTYKTPVKRALEVLERLCAELPEDSEIRADLLEPPQVLGVEAFFEQHYDVRLVAKVPAARRVEIGRRIRQLVLVAFDEAGLEPPTAPVTYEPPRKAPTPGA
jgi:moderate conductance mechanosensitive channel